MKHPRAIVTLAIGEAYRRRWAQSCRANWEDYAARHGYDLVVVEEPLDRSPRAEARSPAWQKLLLAGAAPLRDYDQLVWIDTDIAIHPRAPSIADAVPLERVGGVREFDNPTAEIYRRALRTWFRVMEARGSAFHRNETPREFYRAFGLEGGADDVVNTGVLVFSPRHHRDLFASVYERYEHDPDPAMLAEMRPFSFELTRAGVMHWLDPRFNLLWAIYKAARFPFLLGYPEHPAAARCVAEAFAESHFLHFAGFHEEMDLLDASRAGPPPRRSWFAAASPASEPPRRCDAPVAVLLFNRPRLTARVVEAIRAVRPRQLFLIADGPRPEVPGDVEACAAARAEAERVDWECAVSRNYAEVNLGLKRRVESGLDWLFEQVEEAIILEDDCLPDASFFRFCDELLRRYRDEPRVMAISGSDFTFGLNQDGGDASYFFSRYPLIWGWATWRRAWRLHDPTMEGVVEAIRAGWLESLLDDPRAAAYWAFTLGENAAAPYTWDYGWLLSCWRHGGLSVHPKTNLVSNIGFGGGASHTHDQRDAMSELPVEPMPFPLRHPSAVERDAACDRVIEQNVFSGSLERLWLRLRAHRRALRRGGSGA